MAQRTTQDIDAEIERLEQEKRDLLSSEIEAAKKQAREALLFLHANKALSKSLREALTDKRGMIAITKFFPEQRGKG